MYTETPDNERENAAVDAYMDAYFGSGARKRTSPVAATQPDPAPMGGLFGTAGDPSDTEAAASAAYVKHYFAGAK